MRIAHIAAESYGIPLQRPWGDSTHLIDHFELILVDVTTDTGVTGTGFTITVDRSSKAVQALLEWHLAPTLIGAEIAPRPLWRRMWHELHDAGGGGLTTITMAAIDIAAWDILGKESGRSLVSLLGQFRPAVPIYGSGINLHYSLKDLETQVRGWMEAGYRGVKIKVGKPDLVEDMERVALVRDLIGSDLPLMVDANQAWDVTTAAQRIAALSRFRLEWMEEPLVADDIPGHVRLRALVSTPIALGENVYTRYQANQYMAAGAVDFLQPDVFRVGGITPFMEMAALADAWNIPVAPHHVTELSGQLLCSMPNGRILEDAEGGTLTDLGVLMAPDPIRAGRYVPSTAPGHGFELDRLKLAARRLGNVPPTAIAPMWQPGSQ